ncbi:SDR family NAD(P)-dependent oxidoreductase [bacterium]|nr:SDR family NAD(P)-dependent oxidoreductase [bacterium]
MERMKEDDAIPLRGKTCLVTGATSGIGLATACALAARGAMVVGIGRDPARAERARAAVIAAAEACASDGGARYDLLDLSSLRAVADYAAGLVAGTKALPKLDAVVNCAGFYSDRRALSLDGCEMQFAVNHLAHFCLTTRLLPLLAKAPDARVVTVSSASHYYGRIAWKTLEGYLRGATPRRPYIGIRAYEQSKLANALFTAGLARRAGGALTAFSADPGLVNTEMGLKQGLSVGSLFWNWRRRFGTSPAVPAEAIAWLVAEPALRGKTGLYWKDKQELAPSRRALDPEAADRLWTLSEAFVEAATKGASR